MGIYCDVVSDVGLGTGTAKTQLSGDRSGNATDYTLPAQAKGILWVAPMLYQTTPTANQSVVASMKVESDDLGVKDFEVLAEPIGSNVATTDVGLAGSFRNAIYPLMITCQGGEKVSFYGIAQTANTAAPNMGAQIWWTDDGLPDLPFRARIGGTPGAAGSGTSTGTGTGNVSGANITVSSGGTGGIPGPNGTLIRTIRSVTGIVTATTLASVKPIAGWFAFSAPETPFALRYQAEPVQGPLGTAQAFAKLTRLDNISAQLNTPSTISGSLQLTAAPSTAGNFYQGILYN